MDQPAHPHSPLPPHRRVASVLSEMDFDFSRYINLFLRNIWLASTIVGIVFLGAVAWLLCSPSISASRAVLQVEQSEEKVVKLDDVQAEKLDSLDYLKTIEEAMMNNKLLYQVVLQSGLDKDPDFAPPLKDGEKYSELELADRMSRKVDVKLQRGTRLIVLTVEDRNPERAKELADLMIKEFLRQSFNQRFAQSQVAKDFLNEEAVKLKKKLEASEQELQAYKEKNKAVSLEQSQNIIVEKLHDLNAKVTESKSNLMSLESDLEQLRKLPPDQIDDIIQIGSVASIPDVASQREEIVKAEGDFAAVKKRYLEKHPKYQEAQSQVDRLKESLRDTLKNARSILEKQYQSSLDTQAKLQAALEEQEKEALELNKISIPYNVLLHEVESDRAMYESIITRQRETSITEGIERNPFRIIEEPMIPSKPVKPRKLLTLALSLVLGFGLAGVIIIGRDTLDSSLRTVDAAEQYLDLPCLAVVPDVRKREARQMVEERPIVLVEDPQSMQAEAFRTLRASLSLLGEEANRTVFLVTSAVPSEGKSFTAVNLATSFALEGHRTLLVDADLRRPTIGASLVEKGVDLDQGLTDLLSGNVPAEKVIHPGKVPGLFILSAGRKAPNPAELLGSKAVPEFIRKSREKFDRIVIDSAPVNAVSDTLRIASLTDQTVFIIRSGKTAKKPVLRACTLIRKAGGKIAGFVLNRSQISRAAGSDYYYYGGDYTKGEVYGAKTG